MARFGIIVRLLVGAFFNTLIVLALLTTAAVVLLWIVGRNKQLRARREGLYVRRVGLRAGHGPPAPFCGGHLVPAYAFYWMALGVWARVARCGRVSLGVGACRVHFVFAAFFFPLLFRQPLTCGSLLSPDKQLTSHSALLACTFWLPPFPSAHGADASPLTGERTTRVGADPPTPFGSAVSPVQDVPPRRLPFTVCLTRAPVGGGTGGPAAAWLYVGVWHPFCPVGPSPDHAVHCSALERFATPWRAPPL